jgi:superfamily II DNA or RNA helicase
MNFRYDTNDEKIVISQATRIEYHQLSLWLERYVKGYRFMQPFKMGIWNGKQSYFDNGKVNLGLWKECFNACKEIEVTFNLENRDEFPINRDVTLDDVKKFCDDFFKHHQRKGEDGNWVSFRPYDYQIETAYKILKNRYCMAEVATSGGKSLIISIVYFYTLKKINPDAKLLIVVPSITLVTQFYDNILEYNYGANFLEKWGTKLDFRNHEISEIKEEVIDYDPCKLRMEEIMSDKPRKFTGIQQPNVYIGCYQSLDKWPKEFFQQFHTVVVDEAHTCKASTLTSILKKTFKKAYNRYGVSGTFPSDDSLEILSIQAVLGPKVSQIEAEALVKAGTITPMSIKAVILNHNESEYAQRITYLKKMGAGKDVFQFEKDFIQQSEKRLEFIKKIVEKCDKNTLLLFHTIEYGQTIFNKLCKELTDKEFYYIDGEVSGKKREEIKKQMEKTTKLVEYTILNFGTYEIEVESDFKILLSNGKWKNASDITTDDDIDDNFIEKMKNK